MAWHAVWKALSNRYPATLKRKHRHLGTLDELESRLLLAVVPLTDRIQANRYVPGIQGSPALATDGGGNLIVVWQDNELDGSGAGIYARKFSPTGTPLADQYRINTTTANNQITPRIVPISTGFVVMWQHQTLSGGFVTTETMDVYFQRLDASGNKVGSEVNVSLGTPDEGNARDASLFALADGGFLITWLTNPFGDGTKNILGRRFNSSGTQTGTFTVTVSTHDSEQNQFTGSVHNGGSIGIDITQASDGSFLAYWHYTESPFVPDVGQRYRSVIQAQRFSMTGVKSGGVVTLSNSGLTTTEEVTFRVPGLFQGPGGSFVLLYQVPTLGTVGQRFNSAGVAQGSAVTLIPSSEGASQTERAHFLSNGDIVISWTSQVAFAPDASNVRLYSSSLVSKSSVIPVSTGLNRGTYMEVLPDSARGFWLSVWDPVAPSDGVGDGTANVYIRRYATNDDPENVAPVMITGGTVPYYIAGVGQRLPTELTNGILVRDLLANGAQGVTFTDGNAGALRGIAVSFIDDGLGDWQFTTVVNPGPADWQAISSDQLFLEGKSLLLAADATTRVRLKSSLTPHHTSSSSFQFLTVGLSLESGLTFRAWDRTEGVAGTYVQVGEGGGISAFSVESQQVNVYFEARLWRSFNKNAQLNVYTLEAEHFALLGNPAYEDRSTSDWSGFTVYLSALPASIPTAPMYRMYYGVQFNDDGTETDMGYRYLTTSQGEAEVLESRGRSDLVVFRLGAYFREEGVGAGTGILGYIRTGASAGFAEMSQIYRTDAQNKPTREGGTGEGAPATSQRLQEQGDHVYTTNRAFEKSQPGTWRDESVRGFVRELSSGLTAGETAVPASLGATSEAAVWLATTSMTTPFGEAEFRTSVSTDSLASLVAHSIVGESALLAPHMIDDETDSEAAATGLSSREAKAEAAPLDDLFVLWPEAVEL